MSNAVSTQSQNQLAKIEQVLIKGDLATLTPEERISYYNRVCETVGLNPLTKPFEYITMNGKLVLYANKGAGEQLRMIHNISIKITDRQTIEGVYVVTAAAQRPDGRIDESTGAVQIAGLKGEMLANAMMKAETKSKRRVTLSICGLNMLDESEVESAKEVKATSAQKPAADQAPAAITASAPPAQTSSAVDKAQVRTRRVIGGEILVWGEKLGRAPNEIWEWAVEFAGIQEPSELTVQHLEDFLAHLQYEAGRNGVVAL